MGTETPHTRAAAAAGRAAPRPRRLSLIPAVIATAQLMVALDLTIVNVALLERRRVFVAGLLVFSLASLLGGFARAGGQASALLQT